MKKKAFTLIELLVVVSIIGILATLLTINLIYAKQKSSDAQRKKDITLVASALDNYYADNKSYPVSTNFEPFATSPIIVALVTGKYLTVIPVDPKDYEYKIKSDGGQYKIIALSETMEGASDCSTTKAKTLAGDYCDPKLPSQFQVSSSNNALINW